MWTPETTRIVESLPKGDLVMADLRQKVAQLGSDWRDELKNHLLEVAESGAGYVRFAPSADEPDLIEYFLTECRVQNLEPVIDLSLTLDDALTKTAFDPVKLAKVAADIARQAKDAKLYILSDCPTLMADVKTDEAHFIRAIANLARTIILARKAIDHVYVADDRPAEPLYIQIEKPTRATAKPGDNQENEARLANLRRLLPQNLIFGLDDKKVERYVISNGLTEAEYQWFMDHGGVDRTILGLVFDLNGDENQKNVDLALEYGEHYQMPLWFFGTGNEVTNSTLEPIVTRLKRDGLPIIGTV